jgi:Fur family ferric uptake transcriptional regulator
MSELTQVINELESRGHRLTASRLAVLSEVYAAPDQFAAENIHRNLPRVGRATVFRTIKLLVDESILCRVLLDDGRLLYRWSRQGHHHHLVCKSCGAVRDLSGCGVEALLADALEAVGFSMDGHWLEVYGHCEVCRSQSRVATAEAPARTA